MKKYPFISLKTNHASYVNELKQVACEVVESGWFLNGKYDTIYKIVSIR